MILDELTGLGAQAQQVAARFDEALQQVTRDTLQALRTAGTLRTDGAVPRLALPLALSRVLSHCIAAEKDAHSEKARDLMRHYLQTMPRMRVEQLYTSAEPTATFFHTPLDWQQLPRMSAALDRLFAVLHGADVDTNAALGFADAASFRANTPTLAALYSRTRYGSLMPLLYGYPADLNYFHRQMLSRNESLMATIDRYFTAPMMHELCHFTATHEAIYPPHLDEGLAGWLGVYILPEFAYPAPGRDDAIFAAPWLSQIGQAMARAFGIRNTVRAHAGAVPFAQVFPASFLHNAARLGWQDWLRHRPLHLLSDTFVPEPWIALAFLAAAGRPIDGESLDTLRSTPLVELADALPADDEFDRAITADALRAMCLHGAVQDGSLRTAACLPPSGISVDAVACRVSVFEGQSDPLNVPPRYFLPPHIAAKLLANGIRSYMLRLSNLAAIEDAADAICAASTGCQRDGFALTQ